jgi:hypothetical protein
MSDVKKMEPLRSMDSAPKDGSEVLLQVELRAGLRGKFLVGHYMPGGHCIEDHPPIEEGWYFWNGGMFDKASRPVGWLPISDLAQRSQQREEDAAWLREIAAVEMVPEVERKLLAIASRLTTT